MYNRDRVQNVPFMYCLKKNSRGYGRALLERVTHDHCAIDTQSLLSYCRNTTECSRMLIVLAAPGTLLN